MAKAGLGTTVCRSGVLSPLIRLTVEAGKALAIGVKTDPASPVPGPLESDEDEDEEEETFLELDASEPPDQDGEQTHR